MNRRRATAVAVAAAIVAIAVWYARCDREVTTTGAAPAQPARVPSPVSVGGERLDTGAAPVAATEADDPAPVIERTHEAVHAIGRRCWGARTPRVVPRGQPDDTVGRMELRLRVAIAAGQATVTDSEVVSTRRLTDELRDCIRAGVAVASWPVAAPDGAIEIVELFRMGDYMTPSPDQPPPIPSAATR